MLQGILENTGDLIWSVDRGYKLLFFNSHFKKFVHDLTGKEIDIHNDIRNFIHGFYTDDLLSLCDRALCGEQFSVERKKGEIIIEYFFNPIRNESEEVIGLSVFMRNITERKRNNKKLAEGELRYRSLVEQVSDAIFTTNQHGDYTDVNPGACKLLGYTREELLTMSDKDIVLSEESDKLMSQRYEALKHGKFLEIQLKRKDGSAVDVETNSWLSGGQFVSIVRNITERKKAELELAQTLREVMDYKFALDESSIVAITNHKGIITYVNDNFCKISKYNRNELLGRDHRIINSGYHSKEFIKNLWDTIASGTVWRGEIKNKAKDGATYWVDTTIVPFLNQQGKPYQYVAIRADITERKDAEEQLGKREKLFRALVENNDGIIVMLDENLHATYQSPSADRITGWTLEDKEGVTGLGLVHPEDEDDLKNCLLEANDKSGKAIPLKFRIKHKQGHYVWLEGTITNLLSDQNVRSIIANMRDITEQKNNEDTLRENELRYRSLIEQATDAIYIADATLKYIDINSSGCQMLGYSKEEFLKLSATDLVLDIETNPLKFDELKSGRASLYERTLKRKDGTVMEVEANEKMLEDGRFIMIARDITERKKSEKEALKMTEQLRKLSVHLQHIREEERTNIAREIHDELGQQLTGLKMDASWIIKKISIEDKLIREKLSSMILLIDQTVKTVRRISSDLRPGILDDLGLIPALEWQCTEFQKRMGIKTECHFYLNDFHPERNLSTNIFRIYQEALTNVARHSHATSVETILQEKNGFVELIIKDNGIGFDLDEAKNGNSWGLVGMWERALMFHIGLTIESEKLKGTVLTLKIPLQKK